MILIVQNKPLLFPNVYSGLGLNHNYGQKLQGLYLSAIKKLKGEQISSTTQVVSTVKMPTQYNNIKTEFVFFVFFICFLYLSFYCKNGQNQNIFSILFETVALLKNFSS